MDNLKKTGANESGVDRNVPLENATNMNCKEVKLNHVTRREKLEHLVTTGMIERKCSRGKHCEKMFDRLTKLLKVGRITSTESDEG